MTNSNKATKQRIVTGYARPATGHSDEAPMVITRLSGWIDVSEARQAAPAWIIPTRVNAQAR